MTASKVSRKTPNKPEVDKALAASAAPEIKIAAPAAAKVAPVEAEKTVEVISKAGKTPAKKPSSAVIIEVAQEAAATAKPIKQKKAKLVRDSFTMPESEYAAIAALKKRCLDLGVAAKKSEILRAAVASLAQLNDADAVAAIQSLAAIKTGRPAKAAK